MANVTVTATQVRPLKGALTRTLTAGEAMALGKGIQVAADGDAELWNATSAAGVQGVIGIVVAGNQAAADGDVAAGEAITVVISGPVYLGPDAALDETKLYFAAATDGVITDVAPANFRAVGYPINTTTLFFAPVSTPAGS